MKEQSKEEFESTSEWLRNSAWYLPVFVPPNNAFALKYTAEEQAQYFLDCKIAGTLPEQISVTLGPVTGLWEVCWMQSPVRANHNLKAQATLFCKSWVYSIFFQKVLQGNADWQAGKSYIDPALEELTQYVEWEIESESVVSVWGLPSVCDSLLCPFSHDGLSCKANHSSSVLFYRELRMLLKLESWDSYKGTIWYCSVRAQYRMFFRASSTSFWKHLSTFPGKESLPDASTLPCYFACQSEPDQKVTATEKGKLYFPS